MAGDTMSMTAKELAEKLLSGELTIREQAKLGDGAPSDLIVTFKEVPKPTAGEVVAEKMVGANAERTMLIIGMVELSVLGYGRMASTTVALRRQHRSGDVHAGQQRQAPVSVPTV
jgi:hypothetical protein